ncbi:MAG: mechanosensitive ion channel family protein [Clostridia bacterium]|nr:mechanosensitive ion channel family protein [Clostridia bacterium]
MNQTNKKERTPYEQKLFWRKARMYAVWAVTFVACLVVSLSAFNKRFLEINDPQIKGAYVQIAKLLPTLETNEASLYGTYALLSQSREEAKKMDITLSADTLADSRTAQDILESNYVAERITRLAVGHDGLVSVVMKDTGKIVAHPDEGEIGKTLMVSPIIGGDIINAERSTLATSVVNYRGIPDLDLSRFASESEARNVKLRRLILFPGDGEKVELASVLSTMLFGSIVPYGDYYIVCGIDMWEYLLYMSRAVFISVVACAVLWLFVHYIALMLEKHEQNGKDLRRQLIAYSLVLTVGIFCMSWYVQVLNSVTNDLNAMQSYADSGVSTLKTLQDTQKRVNSWFDTQYLIQCRIARDYVKSKGKENITRKDLADLSGKLGVQYIYVYDRDGKVLVTNSPYDHFRLSDDPELPSNAFRPLLEGADHVIQQPMPHEVSGARCQLIGVSLRDADDLSDGFVQVSINPNLRDYLTQPLGLDSVLTDMVVGLPTAAFAVDKKEHTVSATTGFGYVGESMDDFGYSAEKLRANRNGFLSHGDKTYYAGFGEADDCYLVPIAEHTTNTAAFMISVRIALVVLAGLALILVMALYHYQQSVVDAAPPREEVPEEPAQKLPTLSQSAMQLTGLSSIVRTRQKAGFEKRWHMNTAKADQTPGERVKAIAYKMLLVFCVLNLLPLLYGSLSSNTRLSGLSYVLFGNWEKGVNIFAVSSCLFLLFVLYVFVSLASRVLYNIAKVADMRMETICLLLRSSLKYVSVIVFIYYGLSQFGIPTQALLASAGIITLAVSMGAKDMVNDIIAGFFILLEGNFKVGDFITVGSWSGVVQEIGLRTTRVNRFQDTKILNNSSVKDIINSNEEAAHVTLELPVGPGASQDDIEKILKMELPELAIDVPGVVSVPVYEIMDRTADGGMLLVFSFDVKNSKQLFANRDMNNRLKQLFERYGIAVPGETAGDAPKEA